MLVMGDVGSHKAFIYFKMLLLSSLSRCILPRTTEASCKMQQADQNLNQLRMHGRQWGTGHHWHMHALFTFACHTRPTLVPGSVIAHHRIFSSWKMCCNRDWLYSQYFWRNNLYINPWTSSDRTNVIRFEEARRGQRTVECDRIWKV